MLLKKGWLYWCRIQKELRRIRFLQSFDLIVCFFQYEDWLNLRVQQLMATSAAKPASEVS